MHINFSVKLDTQADDTESKSTLGNVTDLLVMNWFCRFTRIMSIFFIAFTETKNSQKLLKIKNNYMYVTCKSHNNESQFSNLAADHILVDTR